MPDESIVLRIGEEHAVRLAPHGSASDWSFRIEGMTSAVNVQKMWTSRPYEEDEEDPGPAPARAMVFIIRAAAAGEATVRFSAVQGDVCEVAVRVEA
jgi:hypothetical protein